MLPIISSRNEGLEPGDKSSDSSNATLEESANGSVNGETENQETAVREIEPVGAARVSEPKEAFSVDKAEGQDSISVATTEDNTESIKHIYRVDSVENIKE